MHWFVLAKPHLRSSPQVYIAHVISRLPIHLLYDCIQSVFSPSFSRLPVYSSFSEMSMDLYYLLPDFYCFQVP